VIGPGIKREPILDSKPAATFGLQKLASMLDPFTNIASPKLPEYYYFEYNFAYCNSIDSASMNIFSLPLLQ